MNVKEHYDTHLADYYSWIYGGLEYKIEQNREFFEKYAILPGKNRRALDLGAGSGFQSIPLAQLGFEVTAVDFCSTLLDELKQHRGSEQISTLEADICDVREFIDFSVDLVVCMGDTLTHLAGKNEVQKLFLDVAALLEDGSRFILSYRDLSFELRDKARFIPVRSSGERIFSCFLEYHADTVRVYDIVYQQEAGEWQQRISSYPKLRLSKDWVLEALSSAGFMIETTETQAGFVTIIARR